MVSQLVWTQRTSQGLDGLSDSIVSLVNEIIILICLFFQDAYVILVL